MPVGRGSIERATNAGRSKEPEKNKENEMNARMASMDQKLTDILSAIPVKQITPVPKEWSGKLMEGSPDEEFISTIKSFGIIEPVILRRISDSQFQLLSGYQRLKAAKVIGMQWISSRVIEGLSEEEAKKIFILLHCKENGKQNNLCEAKFEAAKRITSDLPVYLL